MICPFRLRPAGLLSLLVLAMHSPLSAAPDMPADVFSRQPYLQMATQDSMRVVFRTRQPILPQIRYGVEQGKLDQVLASENFSIRRTTDDGPSSPGTRPLHSAPAGTYQFEAVLTGLAPDTHYHYALYDMDSRLTADDGTFTFRTLPVPGTARPCTFWVVGDSGTGNASQKAVHEAFRGWRAHSQTPVDFYVHVGDMAYNRGLDSEFQFGFFEIYAPTLRNLVCWPALGNHEGFTSKGPTGTGPYFDAYISPTAGEAGGLPSGTEAYYSWDFGRTHLICLDSHDLPRDAGGAMAQWLKADLEKTKAEWIVAYWHHPAYTKGSHDSDKEKDLTEMREWIMPIIEAGGVDLVLTGHSHIYERSMLMDGAYETPTIAENKIYNDGDGNPQGDGAYQKRPGTLPNEGTIQIVTGHGGQALSRKATPSPIMKKSITEWGSVILTIDGNTLTGRMLNADGEQRDSFQIVKNATTAPVRIATPRPPDPAEGPEKAREYKPQ